MFQWKNIYDEMINNDDKDLSKQYVHIHQYMLEIKQMVQTNGKIFFQMHGWKITCTM